MLGSQPASQEPDTVATMVGRSPSHLAGEGRGEGFAANLVKSSRAASTSGECFGVAVDLQQPHLTVDSLH